MVPLTKRAKKVTIERTGAMYVSTDEAKRGLSFFALLSPPFSTCNAFLPYSISCLDSDEKLPCLALLLSPPPIQSCYATLYPQTPPPASHIFSLPQNPFPTYLPPPRPLSPNPSTAIFPIRRGLSTRSCIQSILFYCPPSLYETRHVNALWR